MPDEPAQQPAPPKGEPPGSDWAAYYRSTIGREPRPLFAKGMAAVEAAGIAPGQAIEIGFGDGRETLALLEAGWRVLAIDPAPAAAEVLQSQVPAAAAGRLEIRSVPAEDADLPPFDLLYAGYSLPFLDADAFDRSGTLPGTGCVLAASSSSTSSARAIHGPDGRACASSTSTPCAGLSTASSSSRSTRRTRTGIRSSARSIGTSSTSSPGTETPVGRGGVLRPAWRLGTDHEGSDARIQRPARVNVTCVTPLGDVVASIS